MKPFTRTSAPPSTRAHVIVRTLTIGAVLGPLCNWDGGALTRMRFTPDLISSVDHFHPSAAGQAKIAEVEWNASSFAAGWK